jgi:hypothetical protein
MSRDVYTVIQQLIGCIPKNDPTSQSLLDSLNKYRENLSYVPPEQLNDILQFNRVRNILIRFLGETPPTNGWQKNVYDVWMDVPKRK